MNRAYEDVVQALISFSRSNFGSSMLVMTGRISFVPPGQISTSSSARHKIQQSSEIVASWQVAACSLVLGARRSSTLSAFAPTRADRMLVHGPQQFTRKPKPTFFRTACLVRN